MAHAVFIVVGLRAHGQQIVDVFHRYVHAVVPEQHIQRYAFAARGIIGILAEFHHIQHYAAFRSVFFHGSVRLHIPGLPLVPFHRRHDPGIQVQLPGESVRRFLREERIVVVFLHGGHHVGGDARHPPGPEGMIVHPFFAVALFAHHDGAGRRKMHHGRCLIVAQKQVDFFLGERFAVHHLIRVRKDFAQRGLIKLVGMDEGIDIRVIHQRQGISGLIRNVFVFPSVAAFRHLHQGFRQGREAFVTRFCVIGRGRAGRAEGRGGHLLRVVCRPYRLGDPCKFRPGDGRIRRRSIDPSILVQEVLGNFGQTGPCQGIVPPELPVRAGIDARLFGPQGRFFVRRSGGNIRKAFTHPVRLRLSGRAPQRFHGFRHGSGAIRQEIARGIGVHQPFFQNKRGIFMVCRKLRLRIFFIFRQMNPRNKNPVQFRHPGFSVCAFDVQCIDLAATGPLTFSAVRAHQAADRTDHVILPRLLSQIHHLMAGEIEQRAHGQRVQQRFLFLQRIIADYDSRHAFHQLLPGAVPRHIQAEAAEDGMVQAGAILVVQPRAPAVSVPQGGQRHRGQIPGGQGQVILAHPFPGVDEGGGFAVAAVLVPHGQVHGVVVQGQAVDHQGVGVPFVHPFQHRAHGDQAADGLQSCFGVIGIHLIAPEHQPLFGGYIPGGEPFFLILADGDILRPHPARAAGGGYLEVFPVRGGGIDRHRLVHPDTHQGLIVEIIVHGIVQDLPIPGEGEQLGPVHRDAPAHRHFFRRVGIDGVGDDQVKILLGQLFPGLIPDPAQIVFHVLRRALLQRFSFGDPIVSLFQVFHIPPVGARAVDGGLVDPGDIFRRCQQRIGIDRLAVPERRLRHLLRNARHVAHRGRRQRGKREEQ